MKKLMSLFLAVVLTAGLAACAGSQSGGGDAPSGQNPLKIKISMTDSADNFSNKLVQDFCDKVNADCGDAFKFEIYPSDQLGGYHTVTEELIRGSVEMVVGGVSANLDERLTLAYAPYLTSSYEDAKTVYAEGSFVYDTMKMVCGELGIEFLGFTVADFSGLSLAKNCPDNPYEANSGGGLQIRAPGSNQNRDFLLVMGYNPSSIEWTEVYSATQTGVVDGFLGAGSFTAYSQFSDVIQYYVPINIFCNTNFIVVSGKVWEKLSDEQRQSFSTHAADLFLASIDQAEAADNEYLGLLEKAGITVVHPKEGDLENITRIAREAAWGNLEELLGTELYQEMMAYYKDK